MAYKADVLVVSYQTPGREINISGITKFTRLSFDHVEYVDDALELLGQKDQAERSAVDKAERAVRGEEEDVQESYLGLFRDYRALLLNYQVAGGDLEANLETNFRENRNRVLVCASSIRMPIVALDKIYIPGSNRVLNQDLIQELERLGASRVLDIGVDLREVARILEEILQD